jgi:hypothetical protein
MIYVSLVRKSNETLRLVIVELAGEWMDEETEEEDSSSSRRDPGAGI